MPSKGGYVTEGEIGPVRFINPLLSLSQADEDLNSLVYSGLMRATASGSYIPDLAKSYTVSSDGTTYTFAMRPDATFHDGTPVTSADVLFTIQLAQNPEIKSPSRADWEGVAVTAPDTHTVVFKLQKAYAPFLQNTTIGILPKHLWSNVSAEEFPFSPINMHPVGTGPFRVTGLQTDSTGSATRYTLAPFAKYALGEPYLRGITFLFYPNEAALVQAFNGHQIDAFAGVSPEEVGTLKRSDEWLMQVPLPRVFGVFFNQSHATVLQDATVRQALNAAINKERLVSVALSGYGVTLDGPIPPGVLGASPATKNNQLPVTAVATSSNAFDSAHIDDAHAILVKGGWSFDQSTGTWTKGSGKSKQTLAFSLATANEPELVAAANAAAEAWQALGAKVTVQIYPLSDFNTNVLRPRNYDAILFGEVVGRTLDLFAFWHSSQRNDPGLNLALYTNGNADTLLSQARGTTDPTERNRLYQQFSTMLQKDSPAVFFFSPDFLYAVPKGLHGVQLGALSSASDRFLNAYQWYTQTQYVWNIFARY